MFHNWRYYPCLTVLALATSMSHAKPFDVQAAQTLGEFAAVIEKSPADRKIAGEQAERLAGLATSDHFDVQLVAIYLLAFADDARSLATLNTLAEGSNELISGFAQFAVSWRRLSKAPTAPELVNAIADARNPYSRILLQNILFVQYRSEFSSYLTKAIGKETSPVVRTDLLYYLVSGTDRKLWEEAEGLHWDLVQFPDNICFILGSVTKNRSKGSEENTTRHLLAVLKKQLRGD